jgi:hypothetical protein
MRARSLGCGILATLSLLLAGAADAACRRGQTYVIKPNTALLVFPGIVNYFITAQTPTSWRVAWQGNSADDWRFQGEIWSVPPATLAVVSSTITEYEQPSPGMIRFDSIWDASMEVGPDRIDFVSGTDTIHLSLRSNAPLYFRTFPEPDNTEGEPATDPFGLTMTGSPGTFFAPPTLYCDDFE